MPEILVEYRKKLNLQEEKKEEPALRDTLLESVVQFSEILTQAEQEADSKLLNF